MKELEALSHCFGIGIKDQMHWDFRPLTLKPQANSTSARLCPALRYSACEGGFDFRGDLQDVLVEDKVPAV
jgi:hypothetical protein